MGSLEQQTVAEPLKSSFCCEIRSKKVFNLTAVPVNESDVLDASGHCWCRVTMQVVGPDGGFVSPQHCGPGRECYKSHFDRD